jgi:hypothetical protein
MELLIDILADTPALFADKLQLLSNQDFSIAKQMAGLKRLLDGTYRLLDQMEEWKKQWDLDNPGCSREIPAPLPIPAASSWQYEGIEAPAWTTIFDYASVYHANTIVLYDATLILLLNYALAIINEANIPAAPTDPQPLDLAKRSYTASLSVCRSVEYHLKDMRRGVVNFHLVFPLRVANQTLGESNPAIGLWIGDILQQIRDGKSSRWTLAKYLLEVQCVSTSVRLAT